MSSGILRESAWLLLGALAGTTACFVMTGSSADFALREPLAVAHLLVFALLVRSASKPSFLLPVPR